MSRKEQKEILYKQLQLLAEESKNATDNELANLSIAMIKTYEALNIKRCVIRTLAFYFFIALANLIICFLIFIG